MTGIGIGAGIGRRGVVTLKGGTSLDRFFVPFAVGFRRIFRGSAMTCARFRRADGDLLDVPLLLNGEVNETLVNSWLSGQDATLDTFVNQGYGSVTLTQTTPSLQPIVAVAGVLEKKNGRICPRSDGTRYMNASAVPVPWGINQAASMLCVAYTSTNGAAIASITTGTSWASGMSRFYFGSGGASSGTRFQSVQWGGNFNSGSNGRTDGALHTFSIVSPSGGSNSGVSSDGDLVTQTVATEVNAAGNNLRVYGTAHVGDGAINAAIGISELMFCSASLSAAMRLAITREQGAYYGITVP